MRNNELFVTFALYMVVLALAIPLLKIVDGYSRELALALLVIAAAPAPILLIADRVSIPVWLTRCVFWTIRIVTAATLAGLAVVWASRAW